SASPLHIHPSSPCSNLARVLRFLARLVRLGSIAPRHALPSRCTNLRSHASRPRPPLGSVSRASRLSPLFHARAALLLFIGSVIGSGIFRTPGPILRQVGGSVILSLLVWIVGGVLSLLGALTY